MGNSIDAIPGGVLSMCGGVTTHKYVFSQRDGAHIRIFDQRKLYSKAEMAAKGQVCDWYFEARTDMSREVILRGLV